MNYENIVAAIVLIINIRMTFMMIEAFDRNFIAESLFLLVFYLPAFFIGLVIPYKVFIQ